MLKKLNNPKQKPNKDFFFAPWGYTKKDFQKWGKQGGRPTIYVNDKERYQAHRRKKARAKLYSGEITGILSMKTGRISKYRTNSEKKRTYRLRKKLENINVIKYV